MYFTIENNIIKTESEKFKAENLGGLGNTYFYFLKKHGNKIAQIDDTTGKSDTYDSILQRITRTAIALRNKGVEKGDRVLSYSNNHLDDCVPVIASFFLGAIPCALDPIYTLAEVTRLLQQVNPKIVFTIPEKLDIIENAVKKLAADIDIIVFGSPKFKAMCGEQEGEKEFQPVVISDPKETAAICFSSGSSGLPKGICLSHYYFFRQSRIVPAHEIENSDEERKEFERQFFSENWPLINYSPLCWITGMNIFFNSIMGGTCRILSRQFDPESFWSMVDKYTVPLAFLTSFQITELVKYGKPENVNTDGFVKLITGGAPLSKTYANALKELYPQTDVTSCYGLTETGMLAQFEDFNKYHRDYLRNNPDSVGFPVRGVCYKVVDLETEDILGPNQEGELRVKTECIMNGYYNQDSKDEFDDEGWFKTGDIVKYDENGCFYVVDRIKEVIKYRSIPVQPTILEKELLTHSSVKQAVVIGKPHEEDGEHPMAVVILHEDSKDTTSEELLKYIEVRVLDKERLRGGVTFVDSVPMTTAGKVKRKLLKTMILEE